MAELTKGDLPKPPINTSTSTEETTKASSTGEPIDEVSNIMDAGGSGGLGPVTKFVKKEPVPEVNLNPLSYVSLVRDFNRFRASAGVDPYDVPGHVFFRVLFHFDNSSDAEQAVPGTDDRAVTSSMETAWTGLLAPSWIDFGDLSKAMSIKEPSIEQLDTLWRSSTAFNYFLLNGDRIRAKQTARFIELLSNISSESPWYFQNIKGLDSAIERQVVTGEFAFKEERDKITIECLDDSYDQRIGTLLDLYRSIVWSWETKREMLPVNLRKFDMTIVAFQMPLRGKHISRNDLKLGSDVVAELYSEKPKKSKIKDVLMTPSKGVTVIYDDGSFVPVASYKAWEFHGCEFDYNASKSGWADIDNAAGSIPKYNIEIFYDDMFETRFNEFIPAIITDVVGDDIPNLFNDDLDSGKIPQIDFGMPMTSEYEAPSTLEQPAKRNIIGRLEDYPPKKTGVGIIDQALGAVTSWVGTKLKKIYLGNMNGLSISKINSQVNQALDGDLWGTVHNVANYVRGNYKGGNATLGSNIFPKTKTTTDRIIELGNIFRANTTLNT